MVTKVYLSVPSSLMDRLYQLNW